METFLKNEPRIFNVGIENDIKIKDFGDINLSNDEQISFLHLNQSRFDFVKKDWGFYATPSINGRLVNEGFKTALVRNESGKIYVMSVHKNKLDSFHLYCEKEIQTILIWLDEYSLPIEKI